MITRMQKIIVQQNLEDDIYEKLKAGGVGIEVVSKYPNQPIEELATILTKGMIMSWLGGIINALDKKSEGFGTISEAAFRGAILRLLKEAKKSE